jgi:hypothetical protein
MHAFWLVLFSLTAGFTASGIVANLYRVCGFTTNTAGGRAFRAVILVLAGPNVLFESAMRGRLSDSWNPISFWLVTTVVLYWSFALGLLALEIAINI